MDLRHLSHLLAVVEHRSFSAAARAMHTVQSNVSTHVAKLERELGTVLIDRHSMQPTAEGHAVIERARRIRTELQSIEDDIVSMRHEVAGAVHIGCIGTTGRWLATPLLSELSDRHPALHPILVDATTTSLNPRVLNGDLDMAVVNTPIVEAGLDTEALFDEERIVMTPRDHPLADAGTITAAELADHPVMLPPVGTIFRDAIDQAPQSGVHSLHGLYRRAEDAGVPHHVSVGVVDAHEVRTKRVELLQNDVGDLLGFHLWLLGELYPVAGDLHMPLQRLIKGV